MYKKIASLIVLNSVIATSLYACSSPSTANSSRNYSVGTNNGQQTQSGTQGTSTQNSSSQTGSQGAVVNPDGTLKQQASDANPLVSPTPVPSPSATIAFVTENPSSSATPSPTTSPTSIMGSSGRLDLIINPNPPSPRS